VEKIKALLQDFGLKVTGLKEVAPFTVDVYFVDGYNNFFSKFFFKGPKGNVVSKHDGKFVLPVSHISEGYFTGKLLERESYFLFKSLPLIVDIDGVSYSLRFKKDVWGF